MDEGLPLRFRAITLAIAGVGVLGLGYLRFCGAVALPPKPPPPVADVRDVAAVLRASSASAEAWARFVRQDAAAAALAEGDATQLDRAFPYRSDEARKVLAVGDAPIEVAGLRLTLAVEEADPSPIMTLAIENLGPRHVAYQVVTETSAGTQVCAGRVALAHNAIVLAPHTTEKRSECAYRPDMRLVVVRVEAMELPALGAWYVARVPPQALALDVRTSKAHRATSMACNTTHAQSLRVAIERGQTTWRDLVDFYARHRCETYEFPSNYKYFKTDAERELPATAP